MVSVAPSSPPGVSRKCLIGPSMGTQQRRVAFTGLGKHLDLIM
jgi:hypothetical protein